jgi:hypothetical protein
MTRNARPHHRLATPLQAPPPTAPNGSTGEEHPRSSPSKPKEGKLEVDIYTML